VPTAHEQAKSVSSEAVSRSIQIGRFNGRFVRDGVWACNSAFAPLSFFIELLCIFHFLPHPTPTALGRRKIGACLLNINQFSGGGKQRNWMNQHARLANDHASPATLQAR